MTEPDIFVSKHRTAATDRGFSSELSIFQGERPTWIGYFWSMQTLPHWLTIHRKVRRYLRFFLPETTVMKVVRNFDLALDPRDHTGPSYYVAKGGPAAFYHYEEAEKSEIL